MHHSSFEGMSSTPRISAEEAMFRNIRARLQGVMASLAEDDKVFINGQTFSAGHFRFLVNECLFPPKK